MYTHHQKIPINYIYQNRVRKRKKIHRLNYFTQRTYLHSLITIPVVKYLDIADDQKMSRCTALSSPSEEGIKKVLYIFEILTFLWKNNQESHKKDFINEITYFLRKFLLINEILTFS